MKKVVINKSHSLFSVKKSALLEIYKRMNNLDKAYVYVTKNITKCYKIPEDLVDSFNGIMFIFKDDLGDTINKLEINNPQHLDMFSILGPIPRENEELIKLLEEWGTERCSDTLSFLRVVEIPTDIEYTIQDNDGLEWIAEKHRTWH